MSRQTIISLFPNNNYRKNDYWGRFPDRLTELLAEAGIRHVVYYRAFPDPKSETPMVTVEQMESPRWIHREIVPWIRQSERCIIHTHGFPCRSGLWSVRGRLRRRFRWVMTDHYPFPEARSGLRGKAAFGLKGVLRRLGYYPDYLVAVSQSNRKRIAGHFGDRGVCCIYNGISSPVRALPPPPRKPFRALFAGRLIPEKGVQVLLEAMALAKRQGVEVHLVVAGGGVEQGAMEGFIRNHQLADCVELCGPTKDIHRLYEQAHLCIIPSIWPEPFNLVSIEAQSYGLPCIYTDRGGLPETQRDGLTGIMVPAGDPEAIVQAIRRLQDHRAEYQRMRLAARENYETHFTLERMAREYFALYRSIFEDMRTKGADVGHEHAGCMDFVGTVDGKGPAREG